MLFVLFGFLVTADVIVARVGFPLFVSRRRAVGMQYDSHVASRTMVAIFSFLNDLITAEMFMAPRMIKYMSSTSSEAYT
jgi:hypothetical protein